MRRMKGKLFYLLAAVLLTVSGCAEKEQEKDTVRSMIYLYPRNALEVSVQPENDGEISCSYPSCGKEWNIIARPDGTMTNLDDGQEYSCLFREYTAVGIPAENPQEGFVVEGRETAAFLQETFSKMGLIPSEYNELILSWFPQMTDNPWNLIMVDVKVNSVPEELRILPEPDSVIQVFMSYKALDAPIDAEQPEVESLQRERRGFTVVEICGAELTHS